MPPGDFQTLGESLPYWWHLASLLYFPSFRHIMLFFPLICHLSVKIQTISDEI